MAIITLTEPTGLLGHEIAVKAAQRLDFLLIDSSHVISKLTKRVVIDNINKLISSEDIPPQSIKKLILNQALKRNVIVLNLGAEILFNNIPGTLHIKITSSISIKGLLHLSKDKNTNYKKLIEALYGVKRLESKYYDLQIKLDDLDTDFALELILKTVEMKGILGKAGITWNAINKLKKSINHNKSAGSTTNNLHFKIPDFAHPSEREFAKVLDYYRIKWEYEPKSFILETYKNGGIKEEFTPDFHLADPDLYIELTTLKQKLVTKKNRKIRKLKELYPDVNIKIFYGKDYQKLLHKFGIK
ncbi:MAG: hypothetical protein IID03_01870 [Candidatus Dadabacteria bacterium]|nr:hypothetical protein [Candidatus Dadabacteria bacterium]